MDEKMNQPTDRPNDGQNDWLTNLVISDRYPNHKKKHLWKRFYFCSWFIWSFSLVEISLPYCFEFSPKVRCRTHLTFSSKSRRKSNGTDSWNFRLMNLRHAEKALEMLIVKVWMANDSPIADHVPRVVRIPKSTLPHQRLKVLKLVCRKRTRIIK